MEMLPPATDTDKADEFDDSYDMQMLRDAQRKEDEEEGLFSTEVSYRYGEDGDRLSLHSVAIALAFIKPPLSPIEAVKQARIWDWTCPLTEEDYVQARTELENCHSLMREYVAQARTEVENSRSRKINGPR